MKRSLFTLVISFFTIAQTFAQSSSPYKTSFKVDAPITAAGIGLSGLGLYLMQEKDPFTVEEAMNLRKRDVNSFDRFSAGNHSSSAKKVSDVMLYGSLAAPALLLFDSDINDNTGQLLALYLETMSITGTLFTMGSAAFPRARPLTYSPEVEIGEKTRANSQNSFFAGHTAAVSTISFFTAKVFHDYNPDSPARPFVWAGAALVPAAVGYLRLEAGKHFLSDNLVGYGVGAAVGILVPQLHKKSNLTGFSVSPSVIRVLGQSQDAVSFQYKF